MLFWRAIFLHWTEYCPTGVIRCLENFNTVSHLMTHHFSLRRNVLLLFSSLDSMISYIMTKSMASDVLLLNLVLLLTLIHSSYAFALARAPQISISAESLVGHLPSSSSRRTNLQFSSPSKVSRDSSPGTKGVSCRAVWVSTPHQDH